MGSKSFGQKAKEGFARATSFVQRKSKESEDQQHQELEREVGEKEA
tara:strand:+ start:396 stop:533 length:138 start_codon:yes stop_codon:yes gene_type:complete